MQLVVPQFVTTPRSGADAVREFTDAARGFGLRISGDAVADNEIHRVPDNEARGRNISGWYVLAELDGILYGSFGSWKYGRGQQAWCSRDAGELTIVERHAIQVAREAQERAVEERRLEAAAQAEADVAGAETAPDDHAYLVAKRVGAHGLKVDGDKLVVPIVDESGAVISTQTIAPDGAKRFLAGGRKKGGFHMIGEPAGTIYVAEGYATAASVHEATGACAVCAFDAGNIAPVVAGLRKMQPRAEIIVCADNDESGAGMDGARRARPDHIVLPERVGDDWNDVWVRDGAAAVRAGVEDRIVRVMASGFSAREMREVEPRKWLYGKHLIRGYVSATVSPGGVGKTTLELTEAIALASGRDLLGVPVKERVRVWHYNLEDPRDELLRRVWAICERYGIDPAELEGWLFLDSGRDCKMVVAEPMEDGRIVATASAAQVKDQIVARDIAVLQVDPFVKSHYASENDNKPIDAVMDVFGDIAKLGCAVDLVHHTRKPPQGFVAVAGDINTARGAGALAGAVRAARTITPMSDREGEAMGIDPTRRSWFVRVDDAKGNMSAPAAEADWYERHSVELAQGDWVGVLAPWSPPDPFDGLGVERAREVLFALDRGLEDGQRWLVTKNANSPRWGGSLLVDMGLSEGAAKAILRTWMSNGLVTVGTYRNPVRRRDESGIFVDLEQMPGVVG